MRSPPDSVEVTAPAWVSVNAQRWIRWILVAFAVLDWTRPQVTLTQEWWCVLDRRLGTTRGSHFRARPDPDMDPVGGPVRLAPHADGARRPRGREHLVGLQRFGRLAAALGFG
jgi:hypothetical protein